jgi:hypothetical protein
MCSSLLMGHLTRSYDHIRLHSDYPNTASTTTPTLARRLRNVSIAAIPCSSDNSLACLGRLHAPSDSDQACVLLLLRPDSEHFSVVNCCAVLRKEIYTVTGFQFRGGRGNSLDPRNYSSPRPPTPLLASSRHNLIPRLLVETHSSHVVSCMR